MHRIAHAFLRSVQAAQRVEQALNSLFDELFVPECPTRIMKPLLSIKASHGLGQLAWAALL
eukprot:1158344-Pelagomonas_calceolata.AAC.20